MLLDVNQALEVARYDIQYCHWRARQNVLTIMLLNEKFVEVLNPLARDYKSIGTMKKELVELQEELAQAHQQVHVSEARIVTALDKLAYIEALVMIGYYKTETAQNLIKHALLQVLLCNLSKLKKENFQREAGTSRVLFSLTIPV